MDEKNKLSSGWGDISEDDEEYEYNPFENDDEKEDSPWGNTSQSEIEKSTESETILTSADNSKITFNTENNNSQNEASTLNNDVKETLNTTSKNTSSSSQDYEFIRREKTNSLPKLIIGIGLSLILTGAGFFAGKNYFKNKNDVFNIENTDDTALNVLNTTIPATVTSTVASTTTELQISETTTTVSTTISTTTTTTQSTTKTTSTTTKKVIVTPVSVGNMQGILDCSAGIVSGYSTSYVCQSGKKTVITQSFHDKQIVTAKTKCYNFGIEWYEIWDSYTNEYYGWIDASYIRFYPESEGNIYKDNAPNDMYFYDESNYFSLPYGIIATQETGLRLRTAPTLESEVILEIPQNATVDILGANNSWCYVRYTVNQTSYYGYSSKDYIQIIY